MSADYHNNGNGHKPKFIIEAYEPNPLTDDQKAVLRSVRRKVREWEIRRKGRGLQGLITGEKLFFDWLLDNAVSLSTCHEGQRGVFLCTAPYASRHLKVTVSTIRRWRDSLERVTGEIWVTGYVQPNSWDWDLYHISCLVAKPESYARSPLGLLAGAGRNRGRSREGKGGREFRKDRGWVGQKSLPIQIEKTQPVESSNLALQGCPATLDTDVQRGSTQMSSLAGHGCPATLDVDVQRGSTPVSSDAGHQSPATLDTKAEHKKRVGNRVQSSNPGVPPEPPPAVGIENFKKMVADCHTSRLFDLDRELTSKAQQAGTPEQKQFYRERLSIVRARKHGGEPPKAGTAVPPLTLLPAPISRATPQEISSLIAQAKAAVEDAPTQQRTKGRQ